MSFVHYVAAKKQGGNDFADFEVLKCIFTETWKMRYIIL